MGRSIRKRCHAVMRHASCVMRHADWWSISNFEQNDIYTHVRVYTNSVDLVEKRIMNIILLMHTRPARKSTSNEPLVLDRANDPEPSFVTDESEIQQPI